MSIPDDAIHFASHQFTPAKQHQAKFKNSTVAQPLVKISIPPNI